MRALSPDSVVGQPLTDIYHQAAAALAAASKDALSADEVVIAQAPEHTGADLAFACFPLARAWRQNPAKIAEEMAAAVTEQLAADGDDGLLASAEAAGPYVNLRVDRPRVIARVLERVRDAGGRYGDSTRQQDERVMMEYVSPNTNKPLHLGHVRNAVLGRAVANLIESQGATVFRTDIINDRGIHIAKSMLAYQRWADGATPESAGTKGDHFVGSWYVRFDQELRAERNAWLDAEGIDLQALSDREQAKVEARFLEESELMGACRDLLQRWEAEDEEVRSLWRTMNAWVYDGFGATYERLGIRFDKHYYESDVYQGGREVILDALERGVFEEADNGAVLAPLSKHPELGKNLQDKVVLRGDGTGLYITQDINLATIKFEEFGLTQSLYCIGSEQNYYMQQLIATLKLLGVAWADGVHHLSYGMVYLPEGKMKSREGTVVDADDLMAELAFLAANEIRQRSADLSDDEIAERAESIGLAAICFALLLVGRETDIQFDPAQSVQFEGKTGPYLQYTTARIAGIETKLGTWEPPPELQLTEDGEWQMVRDLLFYPMVVADAAESFDPSRLVNYLADMAQTFNARYNDLPVLKAEEPVRSSRMALFSAMRDVLVHGMGLLAIGALAEM